MKKFFLLLGLIMLAACSTKYKETGRQTEYLQAILFNENKLYLVGELMDYQFEGDDVLALQKFLQSPLMKQAEAKITYLTVYDRKSVSGDYEISFDTKNLTKAQINQLENEYGFKNAETYLNRHYKAQGQVVKLENRQELLNKYAFAKPIRTKVAFQDSYIEFRSENVERAAGIAIIAPIIIVGAIISAPFELFK